MTKYVVEVTKTKVFRYDVEADCRQDAEDIGRMSSAYDDPDDEWVDVDSWVKKVSQ